MMFSISSAVLALLFADQAYGIATPTYRCEARATNQAALTDAQCQTTCLTDGKPNRHVACFYGQGTPVNKHCQCYVDDKKGYYKYEVTIKNLNFNQPLSRPVLFTHNSKYQLFEFNGVASKGLRIVAEDGDPTVLAEEVKADDNVNSDAVFVSASGIPRYESATYTIKVYEDYPYLSFATMAVNSNDCFIAVNGEKIYDAQYKTYFLPGLDSGTEANNELCTHMPGPACSSESGNLRAVEGSEGFIHVHRGVHGVNMGKNLTVNQQRAAGGTFAPQFYDWRNPMVEFTVKRGDYY
eukprot:Pgem_evm1s1880